MSDEYRRYLKIVNEYINNNYFVSSYIEIQIKSCIDENSKLKSVEKKYLENKIDGFRYEFLKGLGNGNFNLFKLSKRMIKYENLFLLSCYLNRNDKLKRKIIGRLVHLLNKGILLERESSKLKNFLGIV
ncbi:MAG: hypothetical protein ACLS9F_18125 [Clostridium paraputrificum]